MGMQVKGFRLSGFVWLAIFSVGMLSGAGCGTAMEPVDDPTGFSDSSTNFALSLPPELGAGSVRICGQRDLQAHEIYPCRSDIRKNPAVEECPCFDLDADGVPTDGGEPLVFSGLCPSDNVPESLWTFGYEIWSDQGCGGQLLNSPTNENNFRCYDIQDLASAEYANQSVEWLSAGYNHNQIICLTRNAQKDWNFQFCEDRTEWVECGPNTTVLDCGCVPSGSACDCPEYSLENLPWNCEASPENGCDIWCEGPYVQAQAGFMSFGHGNGSRKGLQLGAFGEPTQGQGYNWSTGPNHRFELVYDHKNKKLTLIAWKEGTSNKTQTTMFLGRHLAELNSLEVRLINHERQAVWIELSDLRITGRQEPLASSLHAPAYGTRTHAFWLGDFQGNFTVSGKLRLQGDFTRDAGDAARVEILVGRNLASPPGAR